MGRLALDQLPGFRRRFRVTPGAALVTSEVEDDYHCMRVTLRHDGRVVTAVEPEMIRVPWTVCPGAVDECRKTFTGVALDGVARRGAKTENCTHLHDLAVLAAAHARDATAMTYDILVSDPVEGLSRAELRRDGATVLEWSHAGFQIRAPQELAGLTFDKLKPWIDSLDAPGQEAARLLRWGSILAHGRSRPVDQDTSRLPLGGCYTFQPVRAPQARRIGVIRDFSQGGAQPLDRRAV